jgi:hypothetical protein
MTEPERKMRNVGMAETLYFRAVSDCVSTFTLTKVTDFGLECLEASCS